MSLRAEKANEIISQQTSAAQKVYEAVPIEEQWSDKQIYIELQRRQINMDFRIVQGCLNTLIDAGLVKEPRQKQFRREKIREHIEKQSQPKETEPMATQMPNTVMVSRGTHASAKTLSPLDRLEALSKRAAMIQKMAKELADDIATAAVEIQSQLETSDEKVKKARQLVTLMRELDVEGAE